MRVFTVILGSVLALAGWIDAGLAANGQLELVADGTPRSVLVLPEQPAEHEILAAQELREHIRKMSGATLEILRGDLPRDLTPILIGLSLTPSASERIQAKSDDPAAFLIAVTDKGVNLAGLTPAGTLFAAYEMLEQLGVRWFIPHEIGSVIPETSTIAVKHQETIEYPAFAGRRLGVERIWSRRMRLGGFNAGSHGLGIRVSREEEPELFMHVDGQPTNKLKVSHPEVLRRVVEAKRKVLQRDPDRKYINIGPTDGGGFGHSPWDADDMDPIRGSVSTSDRYVKFFNKVLEELQQDYPEVGVAFYCYSSHMRPPVREKPNPKILPVLAPIDVCRFHAIDNPICWERAYVRQIVDGWKELGVKMMYRGYLFNLADQGLPFSMIRQITAEYPYYHRQNMIACRVETKPAWAYHGPSLYLAAKIMWDPELNVEELLDDYFTKFYGPAAVPMRTHLETVEDAYASADYHTGNVFDVPKILTPAVMRRMRETLEQAEERAPADSIYADRVKMMRMAHDFGGATLGMIKAVKDFDFVEAKRLHDRILKELVPPALSHEPPVLSTRYAARFTRRFWSGTVNGGYERMTGGNEIVAKLPDQWHAFLDPHGGGEELGLWKAKLGSGPWIPLKTYSRSWSNQGLRYYKGDLWYRASVEVPARFDGRSLRLWLGGVDDTPNAWINGQKLETLERGSAPTGRAWEFDVADSIRYGRDNVVVVKVSNRRSNELGTGGLTQPVMLWAEVHD